jgi:hypothetical protein
MAESSLSIAESGPQVGKFFLVRRYERVMWAASGRKMS